MRIAVDGFNLCALGFLLRNHIASCAEEVELFLDIQDTVGIKESAVINIYRVRFRMVGYHQTRSTGSIGAFQVDGLIIFPRMRRTFLRRIPFISVNIGMVAVDDHAGITAVGSSVFDFQHLQRCIGAIIAFTHIIAPAILIKRIAALFKAFGICRRICFGSVERFRLLILRR